MTMEIIRIMVIITVLVIVIMTEIKIKYIVNMMIVDIQGAMLSGQ